MVKKTKKKAYGFGIFAERVICVRLLLTGYRIVERRYKTSAGEVDIIAVKKDILAVVEVKARKDGDVSEVLSRHQMQRISRAALLFIAKHPEYVQHQIRFDLAMVKSCFSVRYIANAWDYEG